MLALCRRTTLTLCLVGMAQVVTADNYRTRSVVEGGPFHGVHGLAFGPDGALYAADIFGSTVHRVDVATGRHRVAVGPPLGNADDIAFAPAAAAHAGTMVWSGVSIGKLYAQAARGKPRLVADNLPGINAVGFSPDGELYVTQTGRANKALWRVDLAGKVAAEKLWDGGGLNGFAINASGQLYAPEAALGRVVRVDLRTREVELIADGFALPTAVEIDSQGRLLVLDFNAGTVTQLDLETGERSVLANIEPGLDNMTMGPAHSPYADKLYISSIGANGIYELDLKTRALRTVVAGQLTAPGGITVLGTGSDTRIYLADMYTVRVVNPSDGSIENLIPISATGTYPTTVGRGRLDGRDVLVTASWFTGRLQVVDPVNGTVLRDEKGFAAPYSVVVLADGSWLVAEAGAAKITRVMPDGTRETWAGGFEYPVGLAVAAGQVYVADADAGVVTGLDLKTRTRRVISNRFKRPEGIAVLPDGTLAVVDAAAAKVYGLDPATGRKTVMATRVPVGLEPPSPRPATWIFNGIFAANGTVYLPSDVDAGLLALEPGPRAGRGPTRKDFERFLSGWSGDYDNFAQVHIQQAAKRPYSERNRSMALFIRKVELPAFGSAVYYGEWLDGVDESKLIRQRIYAFELDEEEGIRLKLHVWPGDNAEFVARTRGAYLDPSKLDGVTPADMRGLVGCDVIFHKTRGGFAGTMKKGACAFPAPATDGVPIYSWSQMQRSANQFSYLDGWYNVDGTQFRRMAVDWNVFDKRD